MFIEVILYFAHGNRKITALLDCDDDDDDDDDDDASDLESTCSPRLWCSTYHSLYCDRIYRTICQSIYTIVLDFINLFFCSVTAKLSNCLLQSRDSEYYI